MPILKLKVASVNSHHSQHQTTEQARPVPLPGDVICGEIIPPAAIRELRTAAFPIVAPRKLPQTVGVPRAVGIVDLT